MDEEARELAYQRWRHRIAVPFMTDNAFAAAMGRDLLPDVEVRRRKGLECVFRSTLPVIPDLTCHLPVAC
jgi:hypothetical protein